MHSYIGLKYKVIKTRAELFAWIKFCDFILCSISSLFSVIKGNFCFYCDAKCLFCSAPKVLILRRSRIVSVLIQRFQHSDLSILLDFMILEVPNCQKMVIKINKSCLFKVNSSLLCCVSSFIVSIHSLHYLSFKEQTLNQNIGRIRRRRESLS